MPSQRKVSAGLIIGLGGVILSAGFVAATSDFFNLKVWVNIILVRISVSNAYLIDCMWEVIGLHTLICEGLGVAEHRTFYCGSLLNSLSD